MNRRFEAAEIYFFLDKIFGYVFIAGGIISLILALGSSTSAAPIVTYVWIGISVGVIILGFQSVAIAELALAVLSIENNTYQLVKRESSKFTSTSTSSSDKAINDHTADSIIVCADCGRTVDYAIETCPNCGSAKRKWQQAY